MSDDDQPLDAEGIERAKREIVAASREISEYYANLPETLKGGRELFDQLIQNPLVTPAECAELERQWSELAELRGTLDAGMAEIRAAYFRWSDNPPPSLGGK